MAVYFALEIALNGMSFTGKDAFGWREFRLKKLFLNGVSFTVKIVYEWREFRRENCF